MLDVTEQVYRYAKAVGQLVPEVQGSRKSRNRWPMKHLAAVAAAIVVVVVVVVVALGPTDSESPVATHDVADGTVAGTLRLVGGRVGSDPVPIPGTVEVQPVGSNETFRVAATADGAFEINLEPGKYEVVGRSPQYRADEPCRADGIVEVRAGETTTATVDCQMR